MSELLIKNILSEILFENRICESLQNQQIINYLYKELLLEKLLYGEPVTVPELRKILHNKIVNFEFIKLDGEIRPAKGTTMMKYIPQIQHPKGIRPSSPKVATFYDLKKRDWRSVSQRSKEIVLKKDEDTGKPVIMVKDKPTGGGNIAVKPEKPIGTIDGKPVEKPEISKVKPIEKTEVEDRFYFINPKTGASLIMDATPKDVIKKLKVLGRDWRLATENEYKEHEEAIEKVSGEEPDVIEVGDVRNYLNRFGKNVQIEIVRQDPDGGIYAKTRKGGIFKIPAGRMQNIGEKIEKNEITPTITPPIIKPEQNLENIEGSEIE